MVELTGYPVFIYSVDVHVLYTKLNYRNIKLLDECNGHSVEVLRRNGGFNQVLWLGFISRQDARRSAGRSVKIHITRVDGVDLAPGEYVQGCLVTNGVYAVIDSKVAIVR